MFFLGLKLVVFLSQRLALVENFVQGIEDETVNTENPTLHDLKFWVPDQKPEF